jgi:amino acid transporter
MFSSHITLTSLRVSSIAEEAKDPARVIPKAIAHATTFTYVIGLAFNLILVICMGDPISLVNSPTGQPVSQLFYNALGRAPAVFFTLAGFAVMNLVAIPGLQGGSRMIYAFSRDELIPLSHVWRRISPRSQTPVAAVWLYAGLGVAVNLLGLVSHTAISAVFNVCTVALNLSYMLPIICKMVYGRFEKGPWNLGRWSFAVNLVAVVWNLFMAVVFFLPTNLPVTSENVSSYLGMALRGLLLLTLVTDELRKRCLCVSSALLGRLLVHSWPPLLHRTGNTVEEELGNNRRDGLSNARSGYSKP